MCVVDYTPLDCSLSDSPIMSRRPTGSSTSSAAVPSSARRSSKIRNSKIKEEAGTNGGGVTTDSDSSPYTSGVPIADNVRREEIELGWNDSAEMSLIVHHHHQNVCPAVEEALPKGLEVKEHSRRYPPSVNSRNSNYSQDDSCSVRGSDEDFDSNQANKPYSRSVDDLLSETTDSLFKRVQETLKIAQQKDGIRHSRALEDFVLVDYSTPHMSLSESTRQSDDFTHETTSSSLKENDDCFTSEMDEMNFHDYRSRSRKSDNETPSPNRGTNNRYSISNSLSFSEPDLMVYAIKNNRESLIDGANLRVEKEENDELLNSLPPTIARKFMDIPLTPQHSKPTKQKHGGKFRFIGGKKKKKHDNEKERKSEPASLPDRRHTLNPSSSLYFNSSNSVKDAIRSSPSKGFSGIFKKKDREAKRLHKSPSMYEDTTDGPIPETPSRKRTGRSSSLAPSIEKRLYMNIDDFGSEFTLFLLSN